MPRKAPAKRKTARITLRSELRVLETLEYFSRISHAARVTEIARALGHPQSSTSRLLAQMAQAGFLIYDRRKRLYHPSARVAMLSVRIMSLLFGQRDLGGMLEELARYSSGPVLLTARNETMLNVVHIVLPGDMPALCYDVGLARPLVASASGQVILGRYADSFIDSLIRRHNAEAPAADRVDPKLFLEQVAAARRQGYLVHPLESAMRKLASRCHLGRDDGGASCCLARGGPYLVMPVHVEVGDDVAVLLSLPRHAAEADYAAHAVQVEAIMARHMPSPVAAAQSA